MRRQAMGVDALTDGSHYAASYHSLEKHEKDSLRATCQRADANEQGFGKRKLFTDRALRREVQTRRGEAAVQALVVQDAVHERSTQKRAASVAQAAMSYGRNDTLAKVVQAAKYESRALALAENRGEKHCRQLLQNWRDTEGKNIVEKFAKQLGMQLYVPDLVATPTSVSHLHNIHHAPPKGRFRNALETLMQQDGSKLGASLDKHWPSLAKPIMRKDSPAIDESERRKVRVTLTRPPPCFIAGVHLCDARGILVHRLRWMFWLQVKAQCPPRSIEREKLEQRRVIVEVTQQSRVSDGSAWGDELVKLDGVEPCEAIDTCTYLHIGNPSFSPWGGAFKQLRAVAKKPPHVNVEVELVPDRIIHVVGLLISKKKRKNNKGIICINTPSPVRGPSF